MLGKLLMLLNSLDRRRNRPVMGPGSESESHLQVQSTQDLLSRREVVGRLLLLKKI